MKEIYINDDIYPNILKKIKNPPKKLFVDGNLDNLNSNCISVVGSRECTEYGKRWCESFIKKFSKYDITIVSGLALGIDGIAHRQALNSNMKTIAVLPCGLNNIFPSEHKELFKQILKNGGTVISEYESETKAEYQKFLERNRIVAGLSIATLVVEAAYRSGTTVTARIAKEAERDVFCIPGSLDNIKSLGTNILIQKGYKMAISPNDIISNYNFLERKKERKKNKVKKEQVPKEYKDLYCIIDDEPKDIDYIMKKTKINLSELMVKLTMLELEGKIKKVAGNRYIKI